MNARTLLILKKYKDNLHNDLLISNTIIELSHSLLVHSSYISDCTELLLKLNA